MAFDPAGRLFYTEKDGNVRLFANGQLRAAPVITFKVNSVSERGLLGIALDPDFSSNHSIYVYYTCDPDGGCPILQNQVVKFTENNGVGSNPTTIFTSPQTAGNHNGGNIHFGPDKMLYISIGENANPPNSPDDCVFARTTTSISADLTTKITPCQFGGTPDCQNCGCVASAGLKALGRHTVLGFIPVGTLFTGSVRIGEHMRRLRPAAAQ